jgi:hypothetical protein
MKKIIFPNHEQLVYFRVSELGLRIGITYDFVSINKNKFHEFRITPIQKRKKRLTLKFFFSFPLFSILLFGQVKSLRVLFFHTKTSYKTLCRFNNKNKKLYCHCTHRCTGRWAITGMPITVRVVLAGHSGSAA